MSGSNKGPNVDYRLQNLTNAMYIDGNDDAVLRTGFTGNIVISGNVNVPGNIEVYSTPDNPVHTHVTEIGTSGILTVPYMPINGNVIVTSIPAITGNVNANVTGSVTVSSLPAITGNVTSIISGNISGITSLPSITGNVIANVTSLPAITGNVTSIISGNISGITSLPAITGNVTSTISGNISGITSLPAITGNVTSVISGNISGITSLPAITGNVNANITAMPAITGNVTSVISGNISGITSLPAITGNVTSTLSGNLAGITGNVNVTQGTSPWVVQGNVTVNQDANTPSLVKYIATPNNLQIDMTERLRVAVPVQSWWYAPTVDKDSDFRHVESIVGANAQSTFVQNLATINMTSGTDSNGSFIRISRRRHKMRPGVGMTAAFSINWNGYVPDGTVIKRVGLFTNYNGAFFEMNSDLNIVIRRRLTDGTLVEKRIARTDFNIDPLNSTTTGVYDLRPIVINQANITAFVSKTALPITGDGTVYQVVFTVDDRSQFYVGQKGRITGVNPVLFNGTVMVTAVTGTTGAGNITVVYNQDPGSYSSLSSAIFVHTNLHNQYVFGFDFNGNRGTNIRFFIDGPKGRTAIHQEDFGGTISTPFMNAPAMSTRYEIYNLASPNRLPNLSASSEVINIEAEAELNPGFGTAANNNGVAYSKTRTDEFAILGIGLRAGEPFQRADLQMQSLQITDIHNINPQNSGVMYWRLLLNPTLGGDYTAPGTSTQVNTGKASRYWRFTTSTTFSGGTELLSGYSTQAAPIDVRAALNFINLGSNVDYTDSDKIVLVVKMLAGGSADSLIVANMNFIEAL